MIEIILHSLFLVFARCPGCSGVTIHRFSFVSPRTTVIVPSLLQFRLVLLLPGLLQVSHELYTLFQALNSLLKQYQDPFIYYLDESFPNLPIEDDFSSFL